MSALTPSFPAQTVPLFVYGSLRPGMELWPEIRDQVIASTPATVRGSLFWHVGMEWPLLTIGGADDVEVSGDLLQLRPGEATSRVIVDEELLYGYDARWLSCDTDDGPQEALVLVWNRQSELGPRIAEGDFVTAARL